MLTLCDKQFLIDCGEGAQQNIMRSGVHLTRLDHIFISHLHGDHCFGLIGLISTLGMLGRTRSLTIHAPADLERLLGPWLAYFCEGMSYEVRFECVNPNRHEVIYEDRTLCVTSLPLKHRVPCCGFLFEEKRRQPHIIKEMIEVYNIPLTALPEIKAGGDFVTESGERIPHERLTRPAEEPFRYAYCSDTAYSERLVPWIEGVDCLYHEATFSEEFASRCRETLHSTACQAATIAKKAGVRRLIIGHFSSRVTDPSVLLREAREIFENTELARDRTVYKL